MNYHIPQDVKMYIIKRRLKRIIPFICLVAVTVLLFEFVPFLHNISHINKALTLSAAFLFICYICGVPLKIIDRSWSGEVVRVQYSRVRRSATPGKPSVSSWREQDFEIFNAFVLTLRTDKGKVIKRKAGEKLLIFTPNDKEEYQPGDYVVHIAGTDHTIILNRKDSIRCAVCGANSEKESEICHNCGRHLVK